MHTKATVRPNTTRVESARGVVGVASLCDDLTTTIMSVPACTVRAPSLGIIWH
jgi:hypothetical protein